MTRSLIMLVLLLPTGATAQLQKGDVFAGTLATFSSGTQTTGGSASGFTVSPFVGKMFTQRSGFGMGIGYSRSSSNTDGTTSNFNTSVNLIHRWYLPIEDRFYFVLHTQATAGMGKQHNENGIVGNTTNVGVSTMPHIVWFATKHWTFEAGFGSAGFVYTTDKLDSEGETLKGASKGYFRLGGFGIGAVYYFRHK